MFVRTFLVEDDAAVLDLWKRCNLAISLSRSDLDIKRTMQTHPELFLVGEEDGRVIATVMGGFDGHRGWVDYLAVDPALQRTGLGETMMAEVEQRLRSLGCPMINIQIDQNDAGLIRFAQAIGYSRDPVVSVSKRLIDDAPLTEAATNNGV